jgi:hypothetical protein
VDNVCRQFDKDFVPTAKYPAIPTCPMGKNVADFHKSVLRALFHVYNAPEVLVS